MGSSPFLVFQSCVTLGKSLKLSELFVAAAVKGGHSFTQDLSAEHLQYAKHVAMGLIPVIKLS